MVCSLISGNWKLFATEIKPIKWKLKNNICITPTIDKLSLVALLKTATAATANQISATLPNTNLQVSLLNPYSLPISSHIYIANMFRNLHMNKLDSNTACGSWLGHLFNASPKNQLIRNENIQTKKNVRQLPISSSKFVSNRKIWESENRSVDKMHVFVLHGMFQWWLPG